MPGWPRSAARLACARRAWRHWRRASWLRRRRPSGRRSLASTSIGLSSWRSLSFWSIDGSADLDTRPRVPPRSALGCGALPVELLRLPGGDLALGLLLAQRIHFLHLVHEVFAPAQRVAELRV